MNNVDDDGTRFCEFHELTYKGRHDCAAYEKDVQDFFRRNLEADLLDALASAKRDLNEASITLDRATQQMSHAIQALAADFQDPRNR
jgi:hypothetical protein